ncbi:ABC transporter ATP-binding protein [Chachezhania sediminis]|uniref:ABC transporter ATP-binding protein n=1 Tax=Chachezhania sediminis TaxID=2599291 RepID=UPI00131B920D|nr:ABC transporter ATP-binding protein [Chachezhania sediminis]
MNMISHPSLSGQDALLTVASLETYYGPIMALRGVSLVVPKGRIVTVLGANGAGKTTLMKTISGAMTPAKGRVVLGDLDITGREPNLIVRSGLTHVPEGREVFPLLTVEENIALGAYVRRDPAAVRQDREMVYDYFPILREKRHQMAGTLSGGQQQMLAIGRALMARPSLMLLDEPSLGLAPRLIKEIFAIIRRLNREQGLTVLLVEQNARMALGLADLGYVLDLGRIVMDGTSEKLSQSRDVQEFYLGQHGETQRDQKRWKTKKTWR